MPSSSLRQLLQSGSVHRWSHSVGADEAPAWGLEELRGRVVELRCDQEGGGATAVTTIAVDLVLAAQCVDEPVAWVTQSGLTFYPPDVGEYGVDLSALAVVALREGHEMLRAADTLLRSRAFGLVVLDFAEPQSIPLGVQARLVGLAKQHDATLVCLSREGANALGSFASMRVECGRRRVDDGVFECSVRVLKDKRRGRRWQHTHVCDGTVGLR